MVMEGKKIVYLTGFSLCVAGFALTIISFSTPYWVISWPRVHSGFKRIGLWEACFAGLILERDPEQIAYHGCWWILASYYKDIREWMMPSWFVATQVMVTLTLILEMLNLIIQIVLLIGMKSRSAAYGNKRVPILKVQVATVLTVLIAILKTIVTCTFGAMVYEDRSWMPRPDLNYLSWSYGLYVLSAFFGIFATMALVMYNTIIRQEYREPPMVKSPPMTPAVFKDTTM